MSAWDDLGLQLSLVYSADEIEQQFKKVSEGVHPDAGGGKGEFERLREARNHLLDEGSRLDLWLKEHSVVVGHSTAISEKIGAMFAQVGQVTNGVDTWASRGGNLNSGLGKALWQKEGFNWKSQVEELIDAIENWQGTLVAQFPNLETQGQRGDFADALALRAELAFLRKWRRELQSRFGKIWEGLV